MGIREEWLWKATSLGDGGKHFGSGLLFLRRQGYEYRPSNVAEQAAQDFWDKFDVGKDHFPLTMEVKKDGTDTWHKFEVDYVPTPSFIALPKEP